MKTLKESLLRTIIATVIYEVALQPFIRNVEASWQRFTYDMLIFAVPVFIAMLLFEAISSKLRKQ